MQTLNTSFCIGCRNMAKCLTSPGPLITSPFITHTPGSISFSVPHASISDCALLAVQGASPVAVLLWDEAYNNNTFNSMGGDKAVPPITPDRACPLQATDVLDSHQGFFLSLLFICQLCAYLTGSKLLETWAKEGALLRWDVPFVCSFSHA